MGIASEGKSTRRDPPGHKWQTRARAVEIPAALHERSPDGTGRPVARTHVEAPRKLANGESLDRREGSDPIGRRDGAKDTFWRSRGWPQARPG